MWLKFLNEFDGTTKFQIYIGNPIKTSTDSSGTVVCRVCIGDILVLFMSVKGVEHGYEK